FPAPSLLLSISMASSSGTRLQAGLSCGSTRRILTLFRFFHHLHDTTAEGASELTSNPQLIGKRWKMKFIEPLNKQLDTMLRGSGSKDSPIMESIQVVGVSVFDTPAFHDLADKRLVIVSDMLQNTAGYSQYRGDESYSRFCTSGYFLKVRSNLEGVDVTILYLRRTDVRHLQGKRHLEFWENYFSDAKARLAHVVSIEG
ncbi:MAG TPA: hypothetical protein VGY99_12955, partial [Candidatus Binataceae bacterium]|nr:hypothetical protein [Candidatus Binataceae bacterium]